MSITNFSFKGLCLDHMYNICRCFKSFMWSSLIFSPLYLTLWFVVKCTRTYLYASAHIGPGCTFSHSPIFRTKPGSRVQLYKPLHSHKPKATGDDSRISFCHYFHSPSLCVCIHYASTCISTGTARVALRENASCAPHLQPRWERGSSTPPKNTETMQQQAEITACVCLKVGLWYVCMCVGICRCFSLPYYRVWTPSPGASWSTGFKIHLWPSVTFNHFDRRHLSEEKPVGQSSMFKFVTTL